MGLQRLSGPDVCNRCLFRFDEQASLTILVDELISLDLVVEDICVFDWRPNLFSSLMPSDRAIRSASISGLGYYDYTFFESLLGMGVVLLLLVFPQLTLTA